MKPKLFVSRIGIFTSLLLLLMFLPSGSVLSQPASAALGTGFTYQGSLNVSGTPANGTYDFEFRLYDALNGGSQVGGAVSLGDVVVTNGLFTVLLNFGNVFDGTALYLEIGVRPGASTGAYTNLTPRQSLSAAPYAMFAQKAPWSGLTGMPAGFADGTDANTTYTAGDGLELAGTQFKGKGTPYQNVVIVAKSGGDFTTITAALNSITTASDTNPFLIYIAPGVYDEQVIMKSYVDIEGSGELTTKISFIGDVSGTLQGADNAELRFLTVENTGGDTYAIAIFNNSASPRLTHITTNASGGTYENYGVLNISSLPTMTDVTASASGVTKNYGVENDNSGGTMTNVTAIASGGDLNYGVYNTNNAWPEMTNVTANAWAGTNSYGVFNINSSPVMTNVTAYANTLSGTYCTGISNANSTVTMTNVTAQAQGGSIENIGVYNENSSPTMMGLIAKASGGDYNYGMYNLSSSMTINSSAIGATGAGEKYGIYNYSSSGTYLVWVNNSQIRGSTNTIRNDPGYTTRIGASQLSGGPVDAYGGIATCAGVYDQAFTFYASTCP